MIAELLTVVLIGLVILIPLILIGGFMFLQRLLPLLEKDLRTPNQNQDFSRERARLVLNEAYELYPESVSVLKFVRKKLDLNTKRGD